MDGTAWVNVTVAFDGCLACSLWILTL